MDAIITGLLSYGIEGIVIAIAFSLVAYLLKQGKTEREEYRDNNKDTIDKFTHSVDKNTEAIAHNTEISVEIVTMLRERG